MWGEGGEKYIDFFYVCKIISWANDLSPALPFVSQKIEKNNLYFVK
jgi:hypothetical protein